MSIKVFKAHAETLRFLAAPGGSGAHRKNLWCVEKGTGEQQGNNVTEEWEQNNNESRMPGHQSKTHHHHTDEHQCRLIFVLEMLQRSAGAVLEKKKLKGGSQRIITLSAHSFTVGVMGIQKI